MNVFHIVGNELIPIKEPYQFQNGDVYVIETESNLWIWLGSKSFADEKFIGSWGAKKIENQNKELKIETINQGLEPSVFKEQVDFEVVEGDTLGFLKSIDTKYEKDFKLLQIKENDEGEIIVSELPVEHKHFQSDDAFVLDAFNILYVWIGKDSQVKEKYEAGRITRQLEVERKRAPIIYVIEEENEPDGFRELIFKLGLRDGILELRKTVKKVEGSTSKKWWQFWKR
ncbi:MAG: hypothetical protein KAU62_04835 [Candidatus Heimdallarchaeota archaeon]|nr:hypothetical protein [Candidatus Heimdallarchaeota archaeon]MCG3255391.1 hypothetical protein [Candidatus Heimdallarchaeota archaeon]MCK4610464.1 hypothetical protein [Candidatus Heimdallarchaeota archaeon]